VAVLANENLSIYLVAISFSAIAPYILVWIAVAIIAANGSDNRVPLGFGIFALCVFWPLFLLVFGIWKASKKNKKTFTIAIMAFIICLYIALMLSFAVVPDAVVHYQYTKGTCKNVEHGTYYELNSMGFRRAMFWAKFSFEVDGKDKLITQRMSTPLGSTVAPKVLNPRSCTYVWPGNNTMATVLCVDCWVNVDTGEVYYKTCGVDVDSSAFQCSVTMVFVWPGLSWTLGVSFLVFGVLVLLFILDMLLDRWIIKSLKWTVENIKQLFRNGCACFYVEEKTALMQQYVGEMPNLDEMGQP